jgi:hypothetical protein
MAVDDSGAVRVCETGHSPAQARIESVRAIQGSNGNADVTEFRGPAPRVIDAAHGHRELRVKPSGELDDEAFGASRIEAEDRLEDPRILPARPFTGRHRACFVDGQK